MGGVYLVISADYPPSIVYASYFRKEVIRHGRPWVSTNLALGAAVEIDLIVAL